MVPFPRLYEPIIAAQLQNHRQMAFLSGPRQVGKTTSAEAIGGHFPLVHSMSWDDDETRRQILAGQAALARALRLDVLQPSEPLCVFDELHKYAEWKNFLKGFFDRYSPAVATLVTGSARLDVYRRGGDSLMGRYFSYRMHPLSVAELVDPSISDQWFRPPRALDEDAFQRLLVHGGFPEPFSIAKPSFTRRWRRARGDLLVREELRDGTGLQDLARVRMLMSLLEDRAGQLTSYSNLSRQIRVASDTVRRWTEILESFYFCFAVRPWHRNLARALRKEPKFYLWEWSGISDPGQRFENLVASALLKAAHCWTDQGKADVELHFIRDKEKREVDFLLVRDCTPWILVEAKSSSGRGLSPALNHYHKQLGTAHALQVELDRPYIEADCFARAEPLIVPARTFLSQLQ